MGFPATVDCAVLQVITGPNLSGKSCYTKQVALSVFLAHVCHVVNSSLDYSRAITASADLLNIYLLLLLLWLCYIRATRLKWCHLDAPSVRK